MIFVRLRFLIVVTAAVCTFSAAMAQESALTAELKLAEQLYRTEGPAAALPQFERLLEEAQDKGDKNSRVVALRFVGECNWRMGEFEVSRDYLELALAASRELSDTPTEANTLNVLGLLEWDSGNFEAAQANFAKASAIAATLGDPRLQGAILNNSSLVSDELGDYPASLAGYRRVLDLYSQVDFPRGEGDTLGNIGGVQLLLGRFNEAIGYYERALTISESLDSVPAMSQDHGNLGFAYDGLGQVEQALQHFDRALQLAESAGLAQEKAYWLRGKANAEIRSGRYDLGLEHHREALEIYRQADAQAPLLDAMHDLGRLLLELGDPISAQEYFEQAKELAQSMGRTRIMTLNELALADLNSRQTQLDMASGRYQSALDRSMDAREVDLVAAAYLGLARLAIDRNAFEEARDLAEEAKSAIRDYPQLPTAAAAELVIADSLLQQQRPVQALQVFDQAAVLARQIGDPDLLWQIEYGRGRSLEMQGDKTAAADAMSAAVSYIESVRGRLREKRFRSGYLQDKNQVYTELVRLQLELGRDDDAFGTSEQLRNFSYSHQATSQLAEVEPDRELAQLRARIRQLQLAIDEERTWPPADQRQLALQGFSTELLAAEQRYQARLDDLAGNQPIDQQRLTSTVVRSRLKSGEALLAYVVSRDNLMLFVLTPENVQTAIVAVKRESLNSRIELLRDLVLQKDNDRWAAPARSLASSLLDQVLGDEWLAGVNRLYLVPHGVLHYLPFAVLNIDMEDENSALIERFDIIYLPSATALEWHKTGDTVTPSLLAVAPARSHLQHAPEEARTIAHLFEPHSKNLNGSAATETAFRIAAPQFRIIHFATHGYFNKLNPLLSGLELEADGENDGLLEVHEIMQLRLNAELVTLSACDTGLGGGFFNEIPAGDEFVGLNRAFLQAGSASVLATLWEVNDLSTLELMKDFYSHLDEVGDQRDKVVALARAQRALLTSARYQHPYYWAPFMLVGAGKPNTNANG